MEESIIGMFSVSILVNFKDSFHGYITCVYEPSTYGGRDDIWQEIFYLIGLCADRWCVGEILMWLEELRRSLLGA